MLTTSLTASATASSAATESDYLRYQIYKNRAFSKTLGQEFLDTIECFKRDFRMSTTFANDEIEATDLGKFISINREENMQLVFQVMNHVFADCDYTRILERFQKVFDISTAVEVKALIDALYQQQMTSFEEDDIKISNVLDSISVEYKSFVDARHAAYTRFLDECQSRGIEFRGSENAFADGMNDVSDCEHRKLLCLMGPASNASSASTALPVATAPKEESSSLNVSLQLLKMFMIVSHLTINSFD